MLDFQNGLTYVIAGCFINVCMIILRAIFIERCSNSVPLSFWLFLSISSSAILMSTYGFYLFISLPKNCSNDYTLILTILSLLSAGIISGFFTFSYNRSSKEERFLPNALAICFTTLFYLLFGAVSYYMGKSQLIESVEYVNILGAVIMGFILMGNLFFDFWDYISTD